MIQEADGQGNPLGDWIKAVPYVNAYAVQREDNYNVCTFDPIDDGTTEDDFFDPSDPFRRYGPSSTCFPEFVYSYQGDTDSEFGSLPEDQRGNATHGPAMHGSIGSGKWVESRFNFNSMRGKRIRLRFLVSSIKLAATWQAAFNYAESRPNDDGWWIDDVQVTDASSTAPVLIPDTKDNSSLPGCEGVSCSFAVESVLVTPPGPSEAPGRTIHIDAGEVAYSGCSGGGPLYRFSIDGDANGQSGDPADTVLRDWSTDPTIEHAPLTSADYLAEVRCSTDPSCIDSATVTHVVRCPISPTNLFPLVTATDKTTLFWNGPVDTVFARGGLAAVSSLNPIQTASLAGISSLDISADAPGSWYLFREDIAPGPDCNSPGSWTSGGPGEQPGRNALP